MILTGNAIGEAVLNGHIIIDPFESARLNPASYDLLLGDEVAIYTAEELDLSDDKSVAADCAKSPKLLRGRERNRRAHLLDSKKRQNVSKIRMSEDGFTLEPGRLYLMHTRERICTHRYVPIIDGKSSIGRLGVFVHVTAGYGDPGFNGQYTLEVATIAHPVVVYPGMRFAQVRFHQHSGTNGDFFRPYDGNYQGSDARGPVRSASWKQFGS